MVLRRGGEQFHPADRFRVFNALVPSILVGFLALVPIGLAVLGVEEQQLWRGVSVLFVLVAVALSITIRRRMRALPAEARQIISGPVAATNFVAVSLSTAACLVHGTTGLLGPPQGGPYFFGLVVFLGIGAMAFVRLVFVRPDA